MPPNLTAPGVYIEEVPSGSRSITGVSTSTAAFIGRAARGETGRAIFQEDAHRDAFSGIEGGERNE